MDDAPILPLQELPPNSNQLPSKKPYSILWRHRGILLLAVIIGASLLYVFFIRIANKQVTALTDGRVTISDKGFLPGTIQIKKGQTITWLNTDQSLHWVMADPYPTGDSLRGFDSMDSLGFNDTYSYRFDSPGKFTYHDQLHPYSYHGTVQVQ